MPPPAITACLSSHTNPRPLHGQNGCLCRSLALRSSQGESGALPARTRTDRLCCEASAAATRRSACRKMLILIPRQAHYKHRASRRSGAARSSRRNYHKQQQVTAACGQAGISELLFREQTKVMFPFKLSQSFY